MSPPTTKPWFLLKWQQWIQPTTTTTGNAKESTRKDTADTLASQPRDRGSSSSQGKNYTNSSDNKKNRLTMITRNFDSHSFVRELDAQVDSGHASGSGPASNRVPARAPTASSSKNANQVDLIGRLIPSKTTANTSVNRISSGMQPSPVTSTATTTPITTPTTATPRDYWMRDELSKECYQCKAPFTTFRRKHHCRVCGQVFCHKCASASLSSDQLGLKPDLGTIRLCDYCFRMWQLVQQQQHPHPPPTGWTGMVDAPGETIQDIPQSVQGYPLSSSSSIHQASASSSAAAINALSSLDHVRRFFATATGTGTVPTAQSLTGKPSTSSSSIFSSKFWTSPLSGMGSPGRSTSRKGTSVTMASGGVGDEDEEDLNQTTITTQDRRVSFSSISRRLRSRASPSAEGPGGTGTGLPFRQEVDWEEGENEHGALELSDEERDVESKPRQDGSPIISSGDNLALSPPPAVPTSDQGFAQFLSQTGGIRRSSSFLNDPVKSLKKSRSQHDEDADDDDKADVPRRMTTATETAPDTINTETERLWRGRRNTINNFKYSATILRDQLSFEPLGRHRRRRGEVRAVSSAENVLVGVKEGSDRKRGRDRDRVSPASHRPLSEAPEEGGRSSASSSRSRHPTATAFGALSEASLTYIRTLLTQILQDHHVSVTAWLQSLLHLLFSVHDNLFPDIRQQRDGGNFGSLDPRHYVKIKKLTSGRPSQSSYLPGVVFTHNVLHKSMQRTLTNPRILFLTFSVDYLRIQSEFASLEPILSQEREYLSHLVGKLCSLQPDVIICERSVSRVALNLLVSRGVVVVANVKPSMMFRLAEYTGGELISSLDRITLRADARLGTCALFYIKSFDISGAPSSKEPSSPWSKLVKRKTYLYFEGCPPDLGGTVILRSDNHEELVQVKTILQFMIVVIYNLKLESSLLKNEFLLPATSLPFQSPVVDNEILITRFLQPYSRIILSSSPNILLPPPFLLQRMVDFVIALSQNRHLYPTDDEPDLTASQYNQTMMRIDHAVQSFITALKNNDVYSLIVERDLPLEIRTGLNYLIENAMTSISPFAHQNLMVLYLNVCTVTSLPCHPPEIHVIDFYTETDMTIGQYLEELCFDSTYTCPSDACQRSMLLHFRSYVHGDARINVIVENFPSPIPDSKTSILMWNLCKICGTVSSVVPMNDATWKYSFGMFLLLSFYHKRVHFRPDLCSHSSLKDHIQYFGLHDLAVRFEYDSIEILEISPAPLQVVMDSVVLQHVKDLEMDTIREKTIKFYASVQDRIAFIQKEEIVMRDMDAKKFLEEFTVRSRVEKAGMLRLLEEKYESSNTFDILALNDVQKMLYTNCCQWDVDFAAFMKKYFLTEKNEKRMTAGSSTALRRLFADSSGSAWMPVSTLTNKSVENRPTTVVDSSNQEPPISIVSNTGLEQWSKESPSIPVSQRALILPKLGDEVKVGELHDNPPDMLPSVNRASILKQAIELADSEALDTSVGTDRMKQPSRSRQMDDNMRQSNLGSSPEFPKIRLDETTFKISENTHTSTLLNTAIDYISKETQFRPDSMEPDLVDIAGTREENNFVGSDANEKEIHAVKETSDSIFKIPAPPSDVEAKRRITEVSSHSSRSQQPQTTDSVAQQSLSVDNERVSLVKTIKDFWSQTSSLGTLSGPMWSLLGGENGFLIEISGWKPLDYPFSASEFCVHDSRIIVREDEPTSVIAFALDSEHYREEIKKIYSEYQGLAEKEPNETIDLASTPNRPVSTVKDVTIDASNPQARSSVVNNFSVDIISENAENQHNEEKLNVMTASPKIRPVDSINGGGFLEQILTRGGGTHIKYQFNAGASKCFCRAYFAEQFDALRKQCGIEDSIIQSLSRCTRWLARGGQSGSSFFKTHDDRFVMKQMSKPEMEAFLRFAPAYFEYMSQAIFHDLPTLLAKIVGVYRIGFKNSQTGRSLKFDVLVMENLFYQRKVSRIFDLKGSVRNRHVQSTGRQNEVLLDENLIEIIGESPLFIREHDRKLLRASVWNDTLFLSKLNVMDYSLLVGMDEERKEFVVGIVDFIRTFTWDKKLESWVKETGLLGGLGKEPTIISPKQYKNRFRDSMERYFLMVPDPYCDPRSIKPSSNRIPNLP